MNFLNGISFLFIGCVATFIGFFIGFLVINYNEKKELQRLKTIERNKKGPMSHYYGDDTV
tara:strand:+ start:345 stop:524 length:180 start_codon:yes stop_codon:yes gene_type:complete